LLRLYNEEILQRRLYGEQHLLELYRAGLKGADIKLLEFQMCRHRSLQQASFQGQIGQNQIDRLFQHQA